MHWSSSAVSRRHRRPVRSWTDPQSMTRKLKWIGVSWKDPSKNAAGNLVDEEKWKPASLLLKNIYIKTSLYGCTYAVLRCASTAQMNTECWRYMRYSIWMTFMICAARANLFTFRWTFVTWIWNEMYSLVGKGLWIGQSGGIYDDYFYCVVLTWIHVNFWDIDTNFFFLSLMKNNDTKWICHNELIWKDWYNEMDSVSESTAFG